MTGSCVWEWRGAQAAEDLEPADGRHLDVEQHEVERLGGGHRERLGAARRHPHAVALQRQPARQRVPVVFVVVDDEQ